MDTLWLSNIDIEFRAKEKQADFHREMEKYRLEREVQNTKPRKPNWLERRMYDLSVWMVTTGERLHQHYHDTAPFPR